MLKKLMNKKKNNKGFSLVELIVVVLIIAIIAVALAPQVMKWVGTSKENVDKNNAATIKSAVNTAVAEYSLSTGHDPVAEDFVINGSNPTTSMGVYQTYVEAVMNGEWPKTQDTTGGFTVNITTSGAVTVTH
jgi:type IV pilus assembly protein PilA